MAKKTKHHRWLREQGGPTKPWNISQVDKELHQAWHHLFGNAHVAWVAELLSDHYFPDYNFFVIPKKSVPIPSMSAEPHSICRKKDTLRLSKHTLFGSQRIKNVLVHINEVWIDPRFVIDYSVSRYFVTNAVA